MNGFPMKDMLGGMLDRDGQGNPVLDVAWIMEGENKSSWNMDNGNKLRIVTNKPLDGSQLLCLDRTLAWLTKQSAYGKNKDIRMFGPYMDKDDEFLKAVQGTFRTRMYPCCEDLFTLRKLEEVRTELSPVLTESDLMDLDETDGLKM